MKVKKEYKTVGLEPKHLRFLKQKSKETNPGEKINYARAIRQVIEDAMPKKAKK